MSQTRILVAALAAAIALPAAALAEITVEDPYARASTAASKSGAAFMQITNSADTPDRLIAARSDVSERVEIHTHLEDANGVMRMVEVEDGIQIPANGTAMLMRGGDHVMFMGLTEPFEQDKIVDVTLVFEQAGEITVEIPVDLNRKPMEGAHGGHGGHNHGHNHGEVTN
ncbi:MAG: copper chaperone PCu(A)C [Pseudomonadota bacterium]